MADVDIGFVLAVTGLGWGLVLAVYRPVAVGSGWPMGVLHARHPGAALILGGTCVILALAYALARGCGGYVVSAAAILVFGVLWAVFWIGFLQVGAQSALLVAPPAIVLLLARWLG